MPVADTSFLIAFFDADDARHGAARKAFEEADHVVISTEILVETLGVVKAKVGRRAAQQVLEDLMRLENVGWEETCDIMTAYRIFSENRALSFADAVVVQHCMRLETGVLTFDERQARVVAKMSRSTDRS